MSKKIETYFVLLPGLRGPEAQIWHDKPTDGNGKERHQPLFQQKLTDDEAALSLDELREKFKDKVNELS
jgi:hypothetical protein